jgi:outer membrane protein
MRNIVVAALASAMLAAAPAQAEKGDWLVRVRGIMVAPTESSGAVQPAFPTGTVAVSNSVMPEVDFTYMATDHFGAELILATTQHDVSGRGALKGVGKLVDSWVLPPTLTLQYHLAPAGKVRPYVGAGINYTFFYAEDASSGLEAAIGKTRVKLDDSFGYALQAGIDFDLTDRVFANIDVKYIDIDTTARLRTGGALNRVNVSIDPIVVGVGLGLRF